MKKILCVGHSACDITYISKEYPVENRKYKVEKPKIMGGGPSGNASYLLGKYNETPSYITTLGTDVYGELIIKELKSVNVDLKNVIVNENNTTPTSIIIVNKLNGSRTILNYRENNIIPDDYALNYNTQPNIILFDGHELELVNMVLKEFPNATTVLDAGSYKVSNLKLASKVDYLVCSEDFAREYSKVNKIDKSNYNYIFSKIEMLNKKNIIITLGEKGCLFKENNQLYRLIAFKTKSVDTTGAGDIFHGAFVYCLSKKYSLIDTLKFASACASLSVEKFGGRDSIPELNKVIERVLKWEHKIIKI